MIDNVASRQAELDVLCEAYGVRRLALFRSAMVVSGTQSRSSGPDTS